MKKGTEDTAADPEASIPTPHGQIPVRVVSGHGGYRQGANKKAIQNWIAFSSHMAGLTGLEPATSGVTGRRCNRLYYSPRFYGIVALLELVGETGLEPVTLGL
jgi:hypothetical protein